MLANGTTPIIFPLREKISLLFNQHRPKSNGGRRVVLLPVLPWVDGDRPPNIQYGRVQGSPRLTMNCWIGFGLCALGARSVRLQDTKQPVLRPSFGGKLTPDVVHGLKPRPAQFFSISGVTRDSSGAVLGNCAVDLFLTRSDMNVGNTVSNADGNFYVKGAVRGQTHYLVSYKAGSPDVAGTTVNTLVAV